MTVNDAVGTARKICKAAELVATEVQIHKIALHLLDVEFEGFKRGADSVVAIAKQ